jgi:hypothetical protein
VPKQTHKPKEYKHISAWGRLLGSFTYYIVAQQKLAASQHAPIDAIFCRDGIWSRVCEIKDASLRDELKELLQ